MANTAEELLAAATGNVTNDILTINLNTRKIVIPSSVTNLGVESDDEVNVLKFSMPRYYNDIDLSTYAIHINYMNAKGEGDIAFGENIEVTDDTITFEWSIGRHAFVVKGNVTFIVCLKFVDVHNGSVLNEFNTTVATLPVLQGLETSEAIKQEYPDVLEQVLKRLTDNTYRLNEFGSTIVELKGDVSTLDDMMESLQATIIRSVSPENMVNISYLFAEGRNEELRTKLDTSYAVVMDHTYEKHPCVDDIHSVRADSVESMQHAFSNAYCKSIEFLTRDIANGVKFEISAATISVTSDTTIEFATPWLQNNKPNERWDVDCHFTLANGTEADGAYVIKITGLHLSFYGGDYCAISLPESTYYKITKDGVDLTLPELRTNFATHFGVDISGVDSKKISMGGGNYTMVYKYGNGTPNLQLANHLFNKCSQLTSVIGLDLTNATTMKYIFNGCSLLTSVDVISTANVTDFAYAFYGSGLTEIIGLDTSNATNLDGTFAKTPITALSLDCAKVTTAKGTFAGCSNLTSLIMNGMTASFSVEGLSLDADALNALFTSLGETVERTITITGCTGADACDVTIAEAKGWTVIV